MAGDNKESNNNICEPTNKFREHQVLRMTKGLDMATPLPIRICFTISKTYGLVRLIF